MEGTMACQGSESQEIGRSSDLEGKDECRENPSKEPDSSYIEPRSLDIHQVNLEGLGDMLREHQLDYNNIESRLLRSLAIIHLVDWEALREHCKKFWHDIPESALRELEIPAMPKLEIPGSEKRLLVTLCSPHSKSKSKSYGTGTIGVRVRLPNQGPFKCLIVGGGGTGKTIYVKRKLMGEFEKKYEPTMGMHEHMLDVPTKQGSTQFLCVDSPGNPAEGADCGIIFCDITAKQTQMDVPMWHDDLYRVCGDIPIVVCGNKMDLKKRPVKTKKVTFHMKKKLQYYEISAKSGYNLDKPFQYLAEKLAGYVEGANCI